MCLFVALIELACWQFLIIYFFFVCCRACQSHGQSCCRTPIFLNLNRRKIPRLSLMCSITMTILLKKKKNQNICILNSRVVVSILCVCTPAFGLYPPHFYLSIYIYIYICKERDSERNKIMFRLIYNYFWKKLNGQKIYIFGVVDNILIYIISANAF